MSFGPGDMCRNCRFWGSQSEETELKRRPCRRFPPVPITQDRRPTSELVAAHPMVLATDRCGEHTPERGSY